MQAQSRFAMSGVGLSSSVSADEHEAVVRELTRGHELTAQLEAEALRALRGQGQAEATAAFILREVSRAFTVCLSIMSSPASAPPPPQPEKTPEPSAGSRKRTVTPHPHFDGYQWRKYGQKKITGKNFPRSYYRCSYHRERSCPATKQVQQHSAGDPPQFVVKYVNDHTCDTPAWEPEVVGAANPLQELDLSGLRTRQQGGAGCALLDERGVKEERERQALVTSLTCVLGGGHSPAGSGSGNAVAVVELEPLQQQQGRDASASSSSAAAAAAASAVGVSNELLHLAGMDDVELDVMDYCFGHSYGLPGVPF